MKEVNVTTGHRPSNPFRALAPLLAVLLLITACTTTTTITAAGDRPTEAEQPTESNAGDAQNTDNAELDSGDTPADEDAPTVPDTDEAEIVDDTEDAEDAGDASDTGTANDSDASADQASGEAGALFEVRGDLPLTIDEMNELVQYVEAETGREFLRPPMIVAQSSEAFQAGLADDIDDFEDDAEASVRWLQALGLTTDGVAEVSQSFINLLSSPAGVAGYYDPEPDELYVPIDALGDDDFRSLMVHELTHALDGQYVDLNVLDRLIEEGEQTGNYEPVSALQAVAEGRASAVQSRWMRANGVVETPPDSLDALAAIEAVPPALVLELVLPYQFGEQFIEGNGGPAETWDLLENPPPSSEDFMVPFGAPGQTIVELPAPEAEGPIIRDVVFGANDVFVWLLGQSLEPDPNTIFPTFTAINGWAGGRAVVWGDDTQSCIRIVLAADTDSDLEELLVAIQPWADQSEAREASLVDDRIIATGCAPFQP